MLRQIERNTSQKTATKNERGLPVSALAIDDIQLLHTVCFVTMEHHRAQTIGWIILVRLHVLKQIRRVFLCPFVGTLVAGYLQLRSPEFCGCRLYLIMTSPAQLIDYSVKQINSATPLLINDLKTILKKILPSQATVKQIEPRVEWSSKKTALHRFYE